MGPTRGKVGSVMAVVVNARGGRLEVSDEKARRMGVVMGWTVVSWDEDETPVESPDVDVEAPKPAVRGRPGRKPAKKPQE